MLYELSFAEILCLSGVILLCLAISGVLLSGRGAWLVAGYNTSSKEEKARWNSKRLCRAAGAFLLYAGLACISSLFAPEWLTRPLIISIPVLAVPFVIWVNVSRLFKTI